MTIKIAKPKGVALKLFGVAINRQFKQKLDQYFESELSDYLINHRNHTKISDLLNKLSNESSVANSTNKSVPLIEAIDGPNIDSIIKSIKLYVTYVTKSKVNDSLVSDLKQFVWGQGFSKKKIQAQCYEDVPKELEKWKSNNTKVYSFSSGSIIGQSTYMTHSTLGDLTSFFNGYIQRKADMDRYDSKTFANIAEIMGETVNNILFLTDNVKEANACLQSGMQCILVSRDDNTFTAEESKNFRIVKSFSEIEFI